jgi:hypothetical protein
VQFSQLSQSRQLVRFDELVQSFESVQLEQPSRLTEREQLLQSIQFVPRHGQSTMDKIRLAITVMRDIWLCLLTVSAVVAIRTRFTTGTVLTIAIAVLVCHDHYMPQNKAWSFCCMVEMTLLPLPISQFIEVHMVLWGKFIVLNIEVQMLLPTMIRM